MELLSIIVPVYNEEENILPFYTELIKHVPPEAEILFVNDGSRDNTLQSLKLLSHQDKRVKSISLSRNYGHQQALFAGISKASGNLFVIMDGDLQHPPSLIPLLVEKVRKGFDVASAKRLSTKNYSPIKAVTSVFFYKLLNVLSSSKIEPNVADFRAFNLKVRNALLLFEETNIFLRGIFNWMGFKQTFQEYNIEERRFGKSKYSLKKMIRLSINGITSFSIQPLRLAIYLGLAFLVIGFGFGAYALLTYYNGSTIQGWTSTIILILLIGGVQIFMIGVLGEYIGKTYVESKKRPMFIIDEEINFNPPN